MPKSLFLAKIKIFVLQIKVLGTHELILGGGNLHEQLQQKTGHE